MKKNQSARRSEDFYKENAYFGVKESTPQNQAAEFSRVKRFNGLINDSRYALTFQVLFRVFDCYHHLVDESDHYRVHLDHLVPAYHYQVHLDHLAPADHFLDQNVLVTIAQNYLCKTFTYLNTEAK